MDAYAITAKTAKLLSDQNKPAFKNQTTGVHYTYYDVISNDGLNTGVVTLTVAENDVTLAIADAVDALGTNPVIKGRKMFPR